MTTKSLVRLFDAHCHLHDVRLKDRVQKVIERAQRANISHVASCACYEEDWESLQSMMRNATRESLSIVPCFGLHPWWAGTKSANYLQILRRILEDNSTASLGEIGLCKSSRGRAVSREVQERVFEDQLHLAADLSRTAILHCVGAHGKLHSVIQKVAETRKAAQHNPSLPPRIILHSYSGSVDMVAAFLALAKRETIDMYFSFNAAQLNPGESQSKAATCLRLLPARNILVETDAPDQFPSELRGLDLTTLRVESEDEFRKEKLNEPCLLLLALQKAALIRRQGMQELAEAVYENSLKAFAI